MSSEAGGGDTITAKTTKVYNDGGHTSIPKEVREKMDVDEGDTLGWIEYNGNVMVTKVSNDE